MPVQVAEAADPSEQASPTRGRPRGPQGPRIRSTPSNTLLQTALASEPSSEIHLPVTPPASASPSKISFRVSGSSHGVDTRPPTPALAPPTPPPAEVALTSSVKVPAPKFNQFTLPPKINLETTPIPYKGLSLEAAQWTFSSRELQQIVSRAIRLSSQESFIRLLSLESLDQNIPQELERLDNLRAVTQSKYRFHTQRRNMLLQGLNAIAMSASGKSHSADTTEVVGRLTTQLSENTADGDRLTEELLRIADQQSQLSKVQDSHWASALAVALRKLHKSYAKRTEELLGTKEHILQLEGELEDAWEEAERMAKEMDEIDTDLIGSDCEDEADIEMAEIVAVHRRAAPNLVRIPDGDTIRSGHSASSRSTRVSAAKTRSIRASGLRPPRKAGGSRPSSSADPDVQSPVSPSIHKLAGALSQRLVPPQPLRPSFLSIGPTISELHEPPPPQNNLEPEDVPLPVEDDTEDSLLQSPLDRFSEPKMSPQSSEFGDASAIPSIWLQSDVPQPKTRIKSLMALGTSRVGAERRRPSSSVLSRVPSFDSARAVSFDSDGIISHGSGRVTSHDSEGSPLPALQPNRSSSSEYIPSGDSHLSRISSSNSDKVLSSYAKLKTLTKRYTLPFHRRGRKSYSLPQL